MLESLLDVLWYNGYMEHIQGIYRYIKSYPKYEFNIEFPGCVSEYRHEINIRLSAEQSFNFGFGKNDGFLSDDPDKPDRILWSVLSEMYGDYGTSPRFGWIYARNRDTILEQFEEWMKDMGGDE